MATLANAVTLGGIDISLNASIPSADRVYTITDPGTNANVIMSEGAQTINAQKTFTTPTIVNNTVNGKVITFQGTNPANTVVLQTQNIGSGATLDIPIASGETAFIMNAGTQNINGSKTFGSAVAITPVTNQLVLGTTNTATISAVAPAASRVYSIQDPGANANVIMSEGSQTINGVKTLSSALTITPASNQMVLGTTNTATISAVAPASSRTYSIQDPLTNANFVMSEGAQTINGAKTLSSALTITPVSNQVVLGTTNTATISAVAPAASRTYSIQDPLANANFVMSEGAQTINGAKTLGSALTITPVSNQVVLGTTNTATISAVAPAASRTYSIQDPLASANFVMSEGNSTINGIKTFGDTTDASSSTVAGHVLSGGLAVAKKAYLGTGLYLPTTGGTASQLNFYEEYSGTLDFNCGTGGSATTTTVNIKITRIGRMCTYWLDQFTCVAGTASLSYISSTALPSRFVPTAGLLHVTAAAPIQTNTGVYAIGYYILCSSGTGSQFRIFNNTFASFTAGNTVGNSSGSSMFGSYFI